MKRILNFLLIVFAIIGVSLVNYSCSCEDPTTDLIAFEDLSLKSSYAYYPHPPEVYKIITTEKGIAMSIYYAPGAMMDTIYYRKFGSSKWSFFSRITDGIEYSHWGLEIDPAVDYPLPSDALIYSYKKEYINNKLEDWNEYEFMVLAKYPEREEYSSPKSFVYKTYGTPPDVKVPDFLKITLNFESVSMYCLSKNYSVEIVDYRSGSNYVFPFSFHIPWRGYVEKKLTSYNISRNSYGYINVYDDAKGRSTPISTAYFDDKNSRSRNSIITIRVEEVRSYEAIYNCGFHP